MQDMAVETKLKVILTAFHIAVCNKKSTIYELPKNYAPGSLVFHLACFQQLARLGATRLTVAVNNAEKILSVELELLLVQVVLMVKFQQQDLNLLPTVIMVQLVLMIDSP